LKIAHINLAQGFRGGERQTALLIEELSKLGYIQTLFVRKRNTEVSLKKYIKNRKILNLEIVKIGKPYFFSILKFRDFDIIHSHETKANQLSYLVNRVLKIPYLITRRVQFSPSKNFFNLAIYRDAKSLVALSTAIKDDLQKLDKNLKIEIIPSAFIKTDISEQRIFENIPKGKKIVGHIGAVVDSHKGQCTIIETAKLLEKTNPEIYFILVGDGKDLASCRRRTKDMKNITFIGYMENPQRYIQNFDIFIFPSIHEGLGSTLLDVMSLAVPIIASETGGIVDIIKDNFNGFLIQPRDSKRLRDKIVELVSDSAVQKKFVENSLKKVLNFSSNRMAIKYQTIYNG